MLSQLEIGIIQQIVAAMQVFTTHFLSKVQILLCCGRVFACKMGEVAMKLFWDEAFFSDCAQFHISSLPFRLQYVLSAVFQSEEGAERFDRIFRAVLIQGEFRMVVRRRHVLQGGDVSSHQTYRFFGSFLLDMFAAFFQLFKILGIRSKLLSLHSRQLLFHFRARVLVQVADF